jgi:hypothetical protein
MRRVAPAPKATATRIYEIDQGKSAADPTLRKYFQAQGLSGEPLESAVVAFSRDALEHAQRALQHAYALDRLGRALSATELRSVSPASQQQWTEMLHQHASDLQQQLFAIRGQLAKLSAPAAAMPDAAGQSVPIENPVQFSQAAGRLLRQVQELNRRVSNVFASGTSGEGQAGQDDLPAAITNALPLQQAAEIQSFARELHASAQAPNHPDAQEIRGDSR